MQMTPVAARVDEIDPAPSGLYLHVDLDVLDSRRGQGQHLQRSTMASPRTQLETQVRSVLASRPVRAVSLTAYDPGVDAEGRVPPIALRLLEAVADHVAEP